MRKFRPNPILLGLVVAGLSWSAARADIISFSPTGAGGTPVDIQSLGAETGNTLARNVISSSSGQLVPGTDFQLLYQTRLSNLTGVGGTTIPGGSDITLVASVTERVLSGTSLQQANIELSPNQAPGSFINLYRNAGAQADFFTGNGFTAGQLIMSAQPAPNLPNSSVYRLTLNPDGTPVIQSFDQSGNPTSQSFYSGTQSVFGSGSARIQGNVTFADPGFFRTPLISTVVFNSPQNTPFDAQVPSRGFHSSGAVDSPVDVTPNIGGTNGLTGPDFQFQARPSISFTAIPEPGTFALSLCLGAVGVIGYGLKSRKRLV